MPSLFRQPTECERPYTVSQINAGIAAVIERDGTPVWVEGEISNFKRASSGHCYLTLKDAQSQIPAVLWRSNAQHLKFEPESGMAVAVIASIRVYQKGGYYQLDIHRIQPAGLGALYAAFEKLKQRLETEGLFDPAHKRPLPETVRRLGVITSRQGAAIRDIVKVVSSRAPQTDIVLIDVPVQGPEAAPAIARAIADMNAHGHVDCMIIGRGGGSIEDLWAFNEEIVVRAIYGSEAPVVSAVGHETDVTLADFAADVRAPTPSAAAEMVVPDSRENQRYFRNLTNRFSYAFANFWAGTSGRFRELSTRSALKRPLKLFVEGRQACDLARDRGARALALHFDRRRTGLASAASQLHALSPMQVLSRGYSVVSTSDGRSVRAASQLAQGDEVRMRFSTGAATAKVTSVAPE